MPARQESCCFTGHRPSKLPWGMDETDARCLRLKARIAVALEAGYQSGYRRFIGGMALGWDLYFCEAALALRAQYPGVTVEAALPCPTQTEGWPREQQLRHARLVAACDLETVVSREYTAGCMLRRDRYMVDHASLLIAAFDGSPGGTRYTMEYAMRQGLEITDLPV